MFQDEPPKKNTRKTTTKKQTKNTESQKARQTFQLEDEQDESVHEQDVETEEQEDFESDHTENQQAGNVIDLPSKGALGYPGSVTYREVMAGDEETLKMATTANYSRTLNRVLKSICHDQDWFYDISIHDRDYILSYIWANTYSPVKHFMATCEHCDHQEEDEVNMLELPCEDIHEKFKPLFPVDIKKTGEKVKIRMVTIRDESNAEKYIADSKEDTVSMNTILMASAIEFNRPMTTKDRVKWWNENVSAKEAKMIRQYHTTFKFGLDTTHNHVCSKCEGVTSGRIPFRIDDVIAPDVSTDFEELLLAD